MAGGPTWTEAEDALIVNLTAKGCTNSEIYEAYKAKYGHKDRSWSAVAKRRAMLGAEVEKEVEPDPPDAPDETIDVSVEGAGGTVAVMASASIKDPVTLFNRSGLDPKVWEIVPDSGQMRKWDVPMKVDDEPVVIPCYYIGIKVRKRWEASDLPSPIVLRVTRPSTRKPTKGPYTSVHASDLHLPHHDPAALNLLYQVLDFVSPNLFVDHGDTLDCEEISKYPKDPMNRTTLKEEIRMGAEHLGTVHAITPNAEHVWLEGNHEERLRRLVWSLADNRQAGEILTLPAVQEVLQWRSLLGIGDLGWETIAYPRHKLLFDRLILCHGEKVRKDSGQTEKAEYNHYGKGGLSGHSHRVGYYGRRDYNGQHGWWGLGCMCAIRTDYVSFPNWQQGFCVLTWSDDRTAFAVERVRIFDGVAYFRGQRFVGDSTSFGELAA